MTTQELRAHVKSRFLLYQVIVLFVLFSLITVSAIGQPSSLKQDVIPPSIHVQILQAEDERRWDTSLSNWLKDKNPAIRARAALAAGRIGNEEAVGSLSSLLHDDQNQDVRAMAAFALGEIESASGAEALIDVVKNTSDTPEVRRRAIEGLGKVAAAFSRDDEARARELGTIILESLRFEGERTSTLDNETILLALTAVLRARPPNAGPVLASF